jgi:hypothetical protein
MRYSCRCEDVHSQQAGAKVAGRLSIWGAAVASLCPEITTLRSRLVTAPFDPTTVVFSRFSYREIPVVYFF